MANDGKSEYDDMPPLEEESVPQRQRASMHDRDARTDRATCEAFANMEDDEPPRTFLPVQFEPVMGNMLRGERVGFRYPADYQDPKIPRSMLSVSETAARNEKKETPQ
jgi:hypothetical protein